MSETRDARYWKRKAREIIIPCGGICDESNVDLTALRLELIFHEDIREGIAQCREAVKS